MRSEEEKDMEKEKRKKEREKKKRKIKIIIYSTRFFSLITNFKTKGINETAQDSQERTLIKNHFN